ncbi:MAG: HAD family phosphatase [Oscillospiraceae bacterium]|nr:HAD family phosphatase [Oscillospiraceae bacterium]
MFAENGSLPQAAIFDLDGTLLDSMWVWHRVDEAFFAARGMALPEDYAIAIQAMTFREVADYTIARFGLPETPESVMAEWNAMSFVQYSSRVELKPGAREYLSLLRGRGVRLAVATSLTTHVMEAVLEHNGVLPWFGALTSADEVPRGKAYPDIYLRAAGKLGVPPERCAAYDDILLSLRGIKAAGMAAIAVYEPASRQNWDEMCAFADGSIRSFQEELEREAARGQTDANYNQRLI